LSHFNLYDLIQTKKDHPLNLGKINFYALFVLTLKQALSQSLWWVSFAFAAASSLECAFGLYSHSFIKNLLICAKSSPTVGKATKSAAALNLFVITRRQESY